MSCHSSQSRQQSIPTISDLDSDYDSQAPSRSSKPHSSHFSRLRGSSIPSTIERKLTNESTLVTAEVVRECERHHAERFSRTFERDMTPLPPRSSSRPSTLLTKEPIFRPMNPAPPTFRSLSLRVDDFTRPSSTPPSLSSHQPRTSTKSSCPTSIDMDSGIFIRPRSGSTVSSMGTTLYPSSTTAASTRDIASVSSGLSMRQYQTPVLSAVYPASSETSVGPSGRDTEYVWLEEIQPDTDGTTKSERSDDATVFGYMKGTGRKKYYVVHSTKKPRLLPHKQDNAPVVGHRGDVTSRSSTPSDKSCTDWGTSMFTSSSMYSDTTRSVSPPMLHSTRIDSGYSTGVGNMTGTTTSNDSTLVGTYPQLAMRGSRGRSLGRSRLDKENSRS